MRVRHYQADLERSILTALIVNDAVLAKVVAGLKDEKRPFESKWSNQIYQWCADFHRRFQRAPRGNLQHLFANYANQEQGDSSIDLIEKYLSGLSEEYQALSDEINIDYMVGCAQEHFNKVRMRRFVEQLEAAMIENDLESAQTLQSNYRSLEFTAGSSKDFMDVSVWKAALQTLESQALMTYPESLGEFFGSQFCPDSFISFIAPEKRGKTFWLIDLAYRSAMIHRNPTLYYSVGDLSENQVNKRFITRATGRPVEPGRVCKPTHLEPVKRGQPIQVEHEEVDFKARLAKDEIVKARERIRLRTATEKPLLNITCTPSHTTSITAIEADIEERIKLGWMPKVVVIDYMDVLANEPGMSHQDFRHQTNAIWAAARRLSQKYHVCLVSATQSDAASYKAWLLTRDNFSEDKRKLAHVTGMCGINQTEDEKRHGIYRLNWVALREGIYYESRYVTTCGSLAVSNPAMKSVW